MPGLAVGHWTIGKARTGCTVLAFERPALTAAEVRGAAPGTREIEALAHGRVAQHANAIVLTGGSAFGLAAADGVMRGLAERGIGFSTAGGPVPIVPAAVIFDLANGEPVSPSADDGQAALAAAVPLHQVAQGAIGAGAGATWDKFHGRIPAGRPGHCPNRHRRPPRHCLRRPQRDGRRPGIGRRSPASGTANASRAAGPARGHHADRRGHVDALRPRRIGEDVRGRPRRAGPPGDPRAHHVRWRHRVRQHPHRWPALPGGQPAPQPRHRTRRRSCTACAHARPAPAGGATLET